MNKEYIPLYRGSRDAARLADELELWARSYAENISCAKAIVRNISAGYDGSRLDQDTARRIIDEFGYDRVNWVMAATVQQGGHERRISDENKSWAAAFRMPPHRTETIDYRVDSPPGLLDIFINQARRAWQELGLFSRGHCLPDSNELTWAGKLLVVNPDKLAEGQKSPLNQIVLGTEELTGNSIFPNHKVRGSFLWDGEKCEFDRSDIIGVLDLTRLSSSERERLEELAWPEALQALTREQARQQQEQSGAEQTPGLSM